MTISSSFFRLILFYISALTASLLLGIIITNQSLASDTKMTVGVFDYPPLSAMKRNGEPTGVLVDLLRVTTLRLGTNIEFRIVPPGRLIQQLSFGSLDMAIIVVIPDALDLPDIDTVMTTVQPMFELPLNLYSSSQRKLFIESIDNTHDFNTLDYFNQFRLGFVRVGTREIHITLKERSNIVFFNSHRSMIKSLHSERIDLAGLNPLAANYWERDLKTNLRLRHSLADIQMHMAFSKKSLGSQALSICNDVWKNLVNLKQAGELADILSNYEYTGLMSYITPRSPEHSACQTGYESTENNNR